MIMTDQRNQMKGQRDDSLEGERYASLLRCSSPGQGDTSPEGQKRINDAFGHLNGAKWVGVDIYGVGVSGSQIFNREDIDEVLALREEKPFELLFVHDLSRLTRGGHDHYRQIQKRLKKAGIRIVSTTEQVPDGVEGEAILMLKNWANNLQGRGISLAAARGLCQSLSRGTRPASGVTPLGMDRLYLGPNDEPRALVRMTPREQIVFDPESMQVRSRRTRPAPKPRGLKAKKNRRASREKREIWRGYQKQKDERSLFVPGDPQMVALVVSMFHDFDVRNWGYRRITARLNESGVLPPGGTKWSVTAVKKILTNPLYLGLEARYRTTASLYNELTPDGPSPVEIDQEELEEQGKRAVPVRKKPREQWQIAEKPELSEFLPPDLRVLAAKRIAAILEGQAGEAPRRRHKHIASDYVLTHLLHSKQSGRPMRGRTVTDQWQRKGEKIKKVRRKYVDGETLNLAEKGAAARHVPADVAEAAVLGEVSRVLSEAEGVSELVRERVRLIAAEEPGTEAAQAAALHAEKAKVEARMKIAYRNLGNPGYEAFEQEYEADGKLVARINRDLAEIEDRNVEAALDPDAAAEAVLVRLRDLNGRLADLPKPELKGFLSEVIRDLVVDLEPDDMLLTFRVVIPASMMRQSAATESTKSQVHHRQQWCNGGTENDVALVGVVCQISPGNRGRPPHLSNLHRENDFIDWQAMPPVQLTVASPCNDVRLAA
jgi:DNA invertase Pin-like site-specific DNA recombinase